jgi:hypothetical protein
VTPAPIPLRALLEGVRRTLRRDTVVAVVVAALCAIPAALLVAWIIGLVHTWRRPGFGPLLIDALIIGAAAAVAWLGTRHWLNALDEHAVAADAERTAGMREGTVRGVLELSRRVPAGTSAGLARRAEADVARGFNGMAPDAVARSLRLRTRKRQRTAATTLAALTLSALVLGFATPDRSRAAWGPLVSPVRNLTPPPMPRLEVSPGDAAVPRGSDVAVTIRAAGRAAVTLHWRMQGDVPRQQHARVISDAAEVTIAAVDAPVQYWVVSPDGAATRRYTLTPADPLLLADLALDVVYPSYTARATEHFQGEIPPLEIPEGTQVIVRGRATRALEHIALTAPAPAGSVVLAVAGNGFEGVLQPRTSGIYEWDIRASSGGDVAVRPAPLEVRVVPDAAPQVDVTYPATDTVLDATLRQAVVADARDDHGIVAAALVSWRVDRTGRSDVQLEEPVAVNGDDRVLLRTLLDAAARSLVPGDTLKFFLRVTDASPRRQTGVSRTISLRLPGMTELRERTTDRADALLRDAEQLARNAAELQQTTRDLERRASAANARRRADRQGADRRGGESSKMDFQEASPSRQMLERQEQLLAETEAMRESLAALERAMERAGLRDAELQQRLEEMRALLDNVLSPEMREQLEQLRKLLSTTSIPTHCSRRSSRWRSNSSRCVNSSMRHSISCARRPRSRS